MAPPRTPLIFRFSTQPRNATLGGGGGGGFGGATGFTSSTGFGTGVAATVAAVVEQAKEQAEAPVKEVMEADSTAKPAETKPTDAKPVDNKANPAPATVATADAKPAEEAKPVAPPKPPPPPPPSVAFRGWVENLKISGVRGGANPRVFVGKSSYQKGDLVNPQLGIIFEEYNDQTRMIVFKDKTGAKVERRN